MKFGVCASFQDILLLPNITFDYLEENVQRFLVPEQPQADFEHLLTRARSLPIPIETANVLIPSHLPLIATPTQQVDTGRLNRYMQTVLRRAEQVGIHVIVFGSGGPRACPPGYNHQDAIQQVGQHLATWSEWARNHGVQFVLEPLRYEETNILNTVAESGALITQLASPGAKLLIDTYHMACNREAPETIVPYLSLITHVHVAEQQERAAPGRHGEDLRPYFSVLHQGGYNQRISIECNWRDFSSEVNQAIAVLREQWATAAL